jgi:hypothetical protein
MIFLIESKPKPGEVHEELTKSSMVQPLGGEFLTCSKHALQREQHFLIVSYWLDRDHIVQQPVKFVFNSLVVIAGDRPRREKHALQREQHFLIVSYRLDRDHIVEQPVKFVFNSLLVIAGDRPRREKHSPMCSKGQGRSSQ